MGEGVIAKLADFGESRRFDKDGAKRDSTTSSDVATMTIVGTPLYCECIRDERMRCSSWLTAILLLLTHTRNIASTGAPEITKMNPCKYIRHTFRRKVDHKCAHMRRPQIGRIIVVKLYKVLRASSDFS